MKVWSKLFFFYSEVMSCFLHKSFVFKEPVQCGGSSISFKPFGDICGCQISTLPLVTLVVEKRKIIRTEERIKVFHDTYNQQ